MVGGGDDHRVNLRIGEKLAEIATERVPRTGRKFVSRAPRLCPTPMWPRFTVFSGALPSKQARTRPDQRCGQHGGGVGQRQKPSWCLVVRTMQRMSAALAAATQASGLKRWQRESYSAAGVGFPRDQPISRPVGETGPQWMNMPKRASCHFYSAPGETGVSVGARPARRAISRSRSTEAAGMRPVLSGATLRR